MSHPKPPAHLSYWEGECSQRDLLPMGQCKPYRALGCRVRPSTLLSTIQCNAAHTESQARCGFHRTSSLTSYNECVIHCLSNCVHRITLFKRFPGAKSVGVSKDVSNHVVLVRLATLARLRQTEGLISSSPAVLGGTTNNRCSDG